MAAVWLVTLIVLVVVAYYLKRRGLIHQLLFKIGYFLYTKTPIGYHYYQRQIRQRPAYSLPHSKVDPVSLSDSDNLLIFPIPFLKDNYCYLIVNRSTQEGVAVDPAHAAVLQQKLKELNVRLKGILTTHKHWDHAGGNLELSRIYPHLPIYGGYKDNPSAATILLNGGEEINICGLSFDAVCTPGHTMGHIVYILKSTTPSCLFTGDHLFIAGCGKVFEGTYEEMYKSLCLIKNMDHASFVFPGHEYSWFHVQFAITLEPRNVDLQEKYESVRNLRAKGYCTVPSTLYEELLYNPCLRTDSIAIRHSLGLSNGNTQAEVLAKLKETSSKFEPKK